MRCWLVQAKPMTSSGLSRLGQRAVGSGPGEVTFLLNTPPLLLSHLVLRTTPPGRKQDRPSPVKVTKPFMLTRKSGKGRRHAYLLYLLWKAYLKLSEEVQDSVQERNEILCGFGRIYGSHWEVSIFQKRMIKGQGISYFFFFSYTEESQARLEHLPNNPNFYNVNLGSLLFFHEWFSVQLLFLSQWSCKRNSGLKTSSVIGRRNKILWWGPKSFLYISVPTWSNITASLYKTLRLKYFTIFGFSSSKVLKEKCNTSFKLSRYG